MASTLPQGSILLRGIHTPITYYQKYNRVLNKTITNAQSSFKSQYNRSDFLNQELIQNIANNVISDMSFNDSFVNEYFKTLGSYHSRSFDAAISSAVNVVSITSRLSAFQIEQAIEEFTKNNISLIKTISERLHEQIFDVISQNSTVTDVNRQQILNDLISRFGVAKSNAQRIARDQSSKFIANLTEIRHKQVGINSYRWLGNNDGRERPTHVANNNNIYFYSNPPAATGNPGDDVNCRCVALGVLSSAMINHLKSI